MAMTRAQSNKKIREDACRAQLRNQKHVEQVVGNIKKIEELAEAGIQELHQAMQCDNREERKALVDLAKAQLDDAKVRSEILFKANTSRMALVSKYLPDLKAQEIKIEDDREKDQSLQITSTDPIEAANQYTLMMKGSTQH